MGGDSRLVPEPTRKHEYLCHFRNVCYSNIDEKFIYYSDESTDEIIRTVQHTFEHEFAEDYLDFILKSVNPTIDTMKGPMPTNVKLFTDNIVMHYSLMYYAYNYLLIDHFYAMWRTLIYFDLYNFNTSRALFFGYKSNALTRDYRYVHDPWNMRNLAMSSWDHKQLTPEIGLKFINELSSHIWSEKPLFLKFKNNFNINDSAIYNDLFNNVFHQISDIDLICFDSIVIEMGYYFRHWDLSYFIQLFTEKHHRIDNNYQQIQNILILAQNEDDGRRQYTDDTDLEAIGKYLFNLFNVNVEIAYSKDIYNKMTLSEQIQWIEQFTVVIHSGGDDSYIHWFMRERSALITMDYFQNNGKYSVHYESDNIEFDPLKKTYYYYMTEQDMEFAESNDKDRNVKFDSKNVYKYRLNPQRLAKYVYSALLWVEHWNEWDETFNKPLAIPQM